MLKNRCVVSLLWAMALAACSSSQGRVKEQANDDPEFQTRLNSMRGKMVQVNLNDNAEENPFATSSAALTAKPRKILSPDDIVAVFNRRIKDVKGCYQKQLEEDSEWAEDLILDISVKKTGEVSEVAVAPRRVSRQVMGQCLTGAIQQWQFPKFTGETDDGLTQEVVNASFPVSFSMK